MSVGLSVPPAAFPLWWEPVLEDTGYFFSAQFDALRPGVITGAQLHLGNSMWRAPITDDYIAFTLAPSELSGIKRGDIAKLILETNAGPILWLRGVVQLRMEVSTDD